MIVESERGRRFFVVVVDKIQYGDDDQFQKRHLPPVPNCVSTQYGVYMAEK